MPRPARICEANLTYHVYSRFIDQHSFMTDDFFKEIMINVLNRCLTKYKFELISYQIMDNHFHFIIKTVNDGQSISRIVQYIKARFAECLNKKLNRHGAVWSERFKDKIIEIQDNPILYFIRLIWYLAYNPVKKNFTDNPFKYKYGSINFLISENYNSPVRLTFHNFYMMLGNNFIQRRSVLLKYCIDNFI